jgi:hypothetical protein
LRKCGCVFSEKAVREVGATECPQVPQSSVQMPAREREREIAELTTDTPPTHPPFTTHMSLTRPMQVGPAMLTAACACVV